MVLKNIPSNSEGFLPSTVWCIESGPPNLLAHVSCCKSSNLGPWAKKKNTSWGFLITPLATYFFMYLQIIAFLKAYLQYVYIACCFCDFCALLPWKKQPPPVTSASIRSRVTIGRIFLRHRFYQLHSLGSLLESMWSAPHVALAIVPRPLTLRGYLQDWKNCEEYESTKITNVEIFDWWLVFDISLFWMVHISAQ